MNDLRVEDSPAYKHTLAELARCNAMHATYVELEAQARALNERFQAIEDNLRWMQHAFRKRKADGGGKMAQLQGAIMGSSGSIEGVGFAIEGVGLAVNGGGSGG